MQHPLTNTRWFYENLDGTVGNFAITCVENTICHIIGDYHGERMLPLSYVLGHIRAGAFKKITLNRT